MCQCACVSVDVCERHKEYEEKVKGKPFLHGNQLMFHILPCLILHLHRDSALIVLACSFYDTLVQVLFHAMLLNITKPTKLATL